MLKISLKNKILLIFIFLPTITFILMSIISGVNINSMVTLIMQRGRELGDTAVRDNCANMEKEFTDELKIFAVTQAEIIDLHLQRITLETKNMVQLYLDLQFNNLSRDIDFCSFEKPLMQTVFSPVSFAAKTAQDSLLSTLKKMTMAYSALKIVYACNRDVQTLGIATNEGIFIGYSWYPYPADFDPCEQDWYRNAIANPGMPVISGPYLDRYSTDEYITCSYAATANGKTVVAVVNIFPAAIAENLVIGLISNRISSFIYTSDGKIINRTGNAGVVSSEDIITNTDGNKALIKSITGMKNGIGHYYYNNEKFYVASAPLRTAKWNVCYTMPEKLITISSTLSRNKISDSSALFKHEIDNLITNSRLIYAIAGLLMLLLIAWIALYFARRIQHSIAVLEVGAIEISRGNLEACIKLNTNDEFQELAESFNRMAKNIQIQIDNVNANLSEQKIINNDLAAAAKIQGAMFPSKFPAFPEHNEFDIYARCVAAREVGGDFYDFCLLDSNRLYCCIGDVSGKGVPAALFMVKVQTLCRYEAVSGATPAKILANVENSVINSGTSTLSASVVCVIIDFHTGEMLLASAGHAPPLLCRQLQFCVCQIPVFSAVGSGAFDFSSCIDTKFILEKGDILFAYTKGVAEIVCQNGSLYAETRLLRDLQSMAGANPKEIIDHIDQQINQFAVSKPSSDLTMLSIKFQG